MCKKCIQFIMIPIWIICLLSTNIWAKDDDHGNTCEDSTSVYMNSSIYGMIETSGDVDVFQLDVQAPGASIAILSKSKTDLYGILKDSNGNVIAEDDDSGELFNFKIGPQILKEGRYCVFVKHYSNHGLGGYELEIKGEVMINFKYTTTMSWTDYKYVKHVVNTSCKSKGWPECSSRSCSQEKEIEVPFEQDIALYADHNSATNCKEKTKRYKIDDDEDWTGLYKGENVHVKKKIALSVYGKTCHNWNCCGKTCSVWIDVNMFDKVADSDHLETNEDNEDSIEIGITKIIQRIPIPDSKYENGLVKNLSLEVTSDNPNVKVSFQQKEDEFVIYASASSKPKGMASVITQLDIPSTMSTQAKPIIKLIDVPEYGNRLKNLKGYVENVDSSAYSVLIFTLNDKWEVKPYESQPLTPLRNDGSWKCDITTNSGDHLAKKIAAFVVPSDFQWEISTKNDQNIPEKVLDASIANIIVSRSDKK
jgi:hypothetical protein